MAKTATLEITLPDADATRQLGARLAEAIQSRALITLIGDLGAGKTTLAQGLSRELGVAEVVNSPTFTMINEYSSGRLPLYHLDLYRLNETGDRAAAEDAAGAHMLAAELDELSFAAGIILVEWADYFRSYLEQRDHLEVELNYSKLQSAVDAVDQSEAEIGRTARISANGPEAAKILERLRIVYFS